MEVEERDFFKDPLSREELQDLAKEEGLGNLFARRSPSLKKLGLDGQDLPESQMMELMLVGRRAAASAGWGSFWKC